MNDAIHRMTYDEEGDSRSDAATRVVGYGREATVVMDSATLRTGSSPNLQRLATPMVELDASQLNALVLEQPAQPRRLPPNLAVIRRSSPTLPAVRSSRPAPSNTVSPKMIVGMIVAMSFVAGTAGALVLYFFF